MLILFYVHEVSETTGVFTVRRETGDSASVTQHGEDLPAMVSKWWLTSAFRLYSK